MTKPNPGSDEAIKRGCTCPVLDNGRGKGSYYGEGAFIYTIGCPVHELDLVRPNTPENAEEEG